MERGREQALPGREGQGGGGEVQQSSGGSTAAPGTRQGPQSCLCQSICCSSQTWIPKTLSGRYRRVNYGRLSVRINLQSDGSSSSLSYHPWELKYRHNGGSTRLPPEPQRCQAWWCQEAETPRRSWCTHGQKVAKHWLSWGEEGRNHS